LFLGNSSGGEIKKENDVKRKLKFYLRDYKRILEIENISLIEISDWGGL